MDIMSATVNIISYGLPYDSYIVTYHAVLKVVHKTGSLHTYKALIYVR